MNRKTLGTQGEQQARADLELRGFQVIAQNWRYQRLGEIDLIAYHPSTRHLCFIEVKTRRSTAFGSAAEALTPSKQETIQRLAEIYMAICPPAMPVEQVSCDVITITPGAGPPEIHHLVSAF